MSAKKTDHVRRLSGILNELEEWIQTTPRHIPLPFTWEKISNIRASLEHVISQEVGQKGKR